MKKGKTIFNQVMSEKRSMVVESIENGASLREINDLYFEYEDASGLSRALKDTEPELMKLHKGIKNSGIGLKFCKLLSKNRIEIEDMIERGYSLTEINDAYFNYNSRKTFTVQLEKNAPELKERYFEVKRIKNHGI